MDRETLLSEISLIEPPDRSWEDRAWERLDQLTKPPRSLGRLESLAAQLACIQKTVTPSARPAAVAVFAGDHGVTRRGVSAYPQEVTAQMVRNFASGGAAINQIARSAGADLVVYDVGVVSALDEVAGVAHSKVRAGTADMTEGPAMSVHEAVEALGVGFGAVRDLVESQGTRVVAIGEMGIGNTTAASALGCALVPAAASVMIGPGTGLDERGVARKREVVEQALRVNADRLDDPLEALAAVGGLEIAAMAGAVLGCARFGAVALIDGFISTAAALVAVRLRPQCIGNVVASHRSRERGHAVLLDALGVQPLLDLDLRLGEASGAALAIPLVDAACAVIGGMATFAEAGVSGAEESYA
ncbi:n(1)-alpha-phosphoribosyltransferase [Coriobacteriaceae bacterium EMTCatB1]|nr:n(1)-alpha-phosphoribosyltransferase [Coriobacteriaceae bacterium EMTCatB1]